MREILFHGKRVDNGEWVEGYFIKTKAWSNIDENYEYAEKYYIVRNMICSYCSYIERLEVILETVCEFTGLYNGAKQKIFEDDIVRFDGELYRVRREDETPGGIWSSTAYILQKIGWDVLLSFEDTIDDYSNEICVEIIGNIHDNPELLN